MSYLEEPQTGSHSRFPGPGTHQDCVLPTRAPPSPQLPLPGSCPRLPAPITGVLPHHPSSHCWGPAPSPQLPSPGSCPIAPAPIARVLPHRPSSHRQGLAPDSPLPLLGSCPRLPTSPHADGHLPELQSVQAPHRHTSIPNINTLKSIMIYEANGAVKLGLLIVFSEDKSVIRFYTLNKFYGFS